MKYKEAMEYISKVGNFGSNYGLERTERILELLGNPHKKLRLIHVAGTNGKGSTTAMITKILMEHGYKVGMYTSPFLEEFEERIQINNCNIPKETLGNLVGEVKVAVDKVIEEGLNHPTEFEIITCLMFLYFYREKIDYGVIEVGLGGRLDSTNVIIPKVSVIASISFDHTNLLGNTLGEIAKEKAGIIKPKVPVVSFYQEREAEAVLKEVAKENNCEFTIIEKEDAKYIDITEDSKGIYQRLLVNIKGKEEEIELSLLGEHQINNMLLALKTCEVLFKEEGIILEINKVKKALKEVRWKGRLEVLHKAPLVVIDGAHNIQGISTLAENVKRYFKYDKLYLILGILADKEVEKMVKTIVPLANKVITVTPHSNRAELAEALKEEVLKYNDNCTAYDNYKEAFLKFKEEAKEDDLILISGSLYMIGDMRKEIK